MEEQLLQGVGEYALDILRNDQRDDHRDYPRDHPRNDPRDDEFPPLDGDSDWSQSLIIRTTANGGLDLRVRDGNLAPQLVDQAILAARVATEARDLEAKSRAREAKARAREAKARAREAKARALEAKARAVRNIVVPVLVLAMYALVALRRRP
ncbi:hypothetical protein OQA88_5244 [Cercophora sp. LCS_1]